MGIMVLDGDDGQAQFMGYSRRIITWMQVTGDDSRFRFEERRHAADGLAQGFDRADIGHVADVRRWIEQVVPADTETVLQFPAHSQDVLAASPAIEERQRRIAPGPAYHIGFAVIPIHDRIVGPQADAAVMAQNEVAKAG